MSKKEAMAKVPSKEEESATRSEDVVPSKSIRPKDFISTLPTREGWSTPLIQDSRYWYRPHVLQEILEVHDTFKPRCDDIILVTQPKCGTTWLKALAFAIANRAGLSFSDHPLLTRHPQHLVPFIEIPDPNTTRHAYLLDTLPSPRLLATHLPFSLLPHEMSSGGGCRIVYLCRDPKDTLVSRWHFDNKVDGHQGFSMELEKAFAMFCEGVSEYGPFWDHCLEYWKESLARPDEVVFLKYEEIKSDPVQAVRKLAGFLGAPFSEEEESSGLPQEVVRLCSFEMLTSLRVNQVGGVDHGYYYMPNSAFFRKGVTGDWANHLSQEMGAKLDLIVQEKLQGSGLAF